MAKLTPKIILGATRLTHKTDLAFALNEHPRVVGPRRYRYHSPLISAEWCGFTPVPCLGRGHGRGMRAHRGLDGLDRRALAAREPTPG